MRSFHNWLPRVWKDGNRNGEHYGRNKCGSLDQALYLMLSSQADLATTHHLRLMFLTVDSRQLLYM